MAKEKQPPVAFTQVERRVIRLICRQFENREIALKLERSLRTVEGYRAAILAKMGAKNTAGLVVYAIKEGIYKIG